MKGLGSRTGHGTAEHVADQYSGLIGMTVAGDIVHFQCYAEFMSRRRRGRDLQTLYVCVI
jgi:hypothetical protein